MYNKNKDRYWRIVMITEAILLSAGKKVIENNVTSIFEAIKNGIKNKISISEIDCLIAFDLYLQKAIVRYGHIKSILNTSQPQEFYDAFVNGDLGINEEVIKTDSIDEIMEISNFIVVNGTGGAGKSTLLKHFFLNEIYRMHSVPIFVELRNIYENDADISECIFNAIVKLGFNLEKKYFKYALDSGIFTILLDGFDEMNDDNQRKFLQELNIFSARYHMNNFIVSSRPCDSFGALENFVVLECQPLTKEQALELVKKTNFETVTKEKFAKELNKSLYRKHRSFASVPLLLTIMLMTFESYASIPGKIHLFYEYAVDTLFHRHDSNKGQFERAMKSKLSKEDFKNIFSCFCFLTYMRGIFSFNLKQIRDIFDEVKAFKEIKFDSDLYLLDLEQSVCLIIRDGLEITFAHRSFQEYFCALNIQKLTDNQQLKTLRKISEERFGRGEQVLFMLYNMEESRFENNFILPQLEDIESEWQKDQDAIDYYITRIFMDVKYTIRGSEFAGWEITNFADKSVRMFDLLRIHSYNENLRSNTRADMEFVNIIKDLPCTNILEHGDRISYSISGKDLCSNLKAKQVFLSTSHGFVIKEMMEFPKKIRERNKTEEIRLNDLLA